MDPREFAANTLLALPYTANDQQVQVVAALARFLHPDTPAEAVFILNGYAGTGKTSLPVPLSKLSRLQNAKWC